MPFKDKDKAKDWRHNYNIEKTRLLHEAKLAQGIPIDRRKKQ
jgi:hypothetical protein